MCTCHVYGYKLIVSSQMSNREPYVNCLLICADMYICTCIFIIISTCYHILKTILHIIKGIGLSREAATGSPIYKSIINAFVIIVVPAIPCAMSDSFSIE